MRGQAEKGTSIAKKLSELTEAYLDSADEHFLRVNDIERRCARANILLGTAMLAGSSGDNEREKAMDLITLSSRGESVNGVHIKPDLWLKLCLGIEFLSCGELSDAADMFDSVSSLCPDENDKVAQSYSYMGKAWCAFLTGKTELCEETVELVLQYASSSCHVPLHVWALELRILMRAIVGDTEGVDEDQRLIRSLQRRGKIVFLNSDLYSKKDNYSATTSAIIAFSLTTNKQFERAIPYAVNACKKLSSKPQGTALGGVYIFCATYALLDIYEHKITPKKYKRISNMRSRSNSVYSNVNIASLFEDGEKSGMMSSSGGDSVPFQLKDICRSLLDLAKKSYESLSQHSERFAYLELMVMLLSLRLQRIDGANGSLLFDFDQKFKTLPDSYLQDIFSCAYLHLQRSILCEKLNVSFDCGKHGDSRVLAKKLFSCFGAFPEELENLGEPRRELIKSPSKNEPLHSPEDREKDDSDSGEESELDSPSLDYNRMSTHLSAMFSRKNSSMSPQRPIRRLTVNSANETTVKIANPSPRVSERRNSPFTFSMSRDSMDSPKSTRSHVKLSKPIKFENSSDNIKQENVIVD